MSATGIKDKQSLRVLLVKPYQPNGNKPACMPSLGLLYLAAGLREALPGNVDVAYVDMYLEKRRYDSLGKELQAFSPDIVGFSALSCESEEAYRAAAFIREQRPDIKLALGGPYTHGNLDLVSAKNIFDWAIDGEADRSFPELVRRYFENESDLSDIPGLLWRKGTTYIRNNGSSEEKDLDSLPFPAWDLVDFDAYAKQPTMMSNLKGKRYAPLFTSRGCPYKCTYCHDIFGKKFRHRSPENVLEEIQILRELYGVDELEIVDDIFNLHKPRLKKICQSLQGLHMHICFPNGLRADILTQDTVQALADAGTYEVAVAVETVTPRLQDLVEKYVKLPALMDAVTWMEQAGIAVKGYFMLGFPSESEAEIQDTIRFAVRSGLTFAAFFLVIPQRGTKIYELARELDPVALERVSLDDYYSTTSWYAEATGIDLKRIQRNAYLRFYFGSPARLVRILQSTSNRQIVKGLAEMLKILRPKQALPKVFSS